MANPDHVEILKQGVEAWNRWRKKNPWTQPDLCNARLTGVKLFYNLNLSEAELSGADLSDATLIMADLSGANLSKADLCRADISSASLAGATLSQAFLFGAKLTDTDLSTANLSKANLSKASLAGADLSRSTLLGANLFEANLWEANLDTANFTEANLSGAKLTETNLSGAIFHRCLIGYTEFVNVNLKDVQNLETAKHIGPSYISISTIFNSGRDVPGVFLRGCGLPEIFIEHLPALVAKPIQFSSCFISFSDADKPFAAKLHDYLQARGVRCWLAEHPARPRDDSAQRVERGISKWDRVLLCCSKTSLNSWWVENEINRAVKKEQQMLKDKGAKVVALIPLDLDGYLIKNEWRSSKKDEMLSRRVVEFTGWETDNARFEGQAEGVVNALRTGAGAVDVPSDPRR